MSILAVIVGIAVIVLFIVAGWKIFEKAGQPGWACLVPLYGNYIEYKIFWGNGWLFLMPIAAALLSAIPIVGFIASIASLVIYVLSCRKRAAAFGQGIGFTLGLVFLFPFFNLALAYGNYTYFGVPQDGLSYDQMRAKVADERARSANMNYQQPPVEQYAPDNMAYTSPEASMATAAPANAAAGFCPNCGCACQQGERFCKKCGTKLD